MDTLRVGTFSGTLIANRFLNHRLQYPISRAPRSLLDKASVEAGRRVILLLLHSTPFWFDASIRSIHIVPDLQICNKRC